MVGQGAAISHAYVHSHHHSSNHHHHHHAPSVAGFIDFVERKTGIDLDGDGRIGLTNSPEDLTGKKRVILFLCCLPQVTFVETCAPVRISLFQIQYSPSLSYL